jgi:hypothetical protein
MSPQHSLTLRFGSVIIAAMLLTACRSTPSEQPIELSGFWLAHQGEIKQFSPCGDGQCGWGISANGGRVGLWSRSGALLSDSKLTDLGEVIGLWPVQVSSEFRTWVGLADGRVVLITIQKDSTTGRPLLNRTSIRELSWNEKFAKAIVTSPDSRYAWVVPALGHGLYLVDRDSPGSSLTVAHLVLENRTVGRVYPTQLGDSAWISLAPDPGLYLGRADGTVMNLSGSLPSDATVGWVYPLPDGTHAWLDIREKSRRLSSDNEFVGQFNTHDKSFYNPNLYLADTAGNILGVRESLFQNKSIRYCSMPLAEPQQLWIITDEDLGVFLVKPTERGLRISERFLEGTKLESVYSSKNGIQALAVAAGRKRVFQLNVGADARPILNLLPEEGFISIISLSQNQKFAWISLSKALTKYGLAIIPLEQGTGSRSNVFFSEVVIQIYPLPGDTHACIVTNSWSEDSRSSQNPTPTIGRRNNIYVVSKDGIPLNEGRALVEQEGQVFPWYELDYMWLGTSRSVGASSPRQHEIYALGTKDYVETATVKFDNADRLDYDRKKEATQNTFRLTLGETIKKVDVEVRLHNGDIKECLGCRAQLRLTDDSKSLQVAESGTINLWEDKPLQLNWEPQFDYPYELILHLEDSSKTQFNIKWRNVFFRMPLGERKWFRSLVMVVIACAVFLGMVVIPWPGEFVRRWLPPAVLLVLGFAGTTVFSSFVRGDASLAWFLICLISFVAPWFIGLRYPDVLLKLGPTEPFQYVLPKLLHFSSVRRKVFAEYARSVRERMERDRLLANKEIYVEIPAQIRGVADLGMMPSPASALLDALNNRTKPTNVLVESAGGRGKTALLRQIVLLSIERFLRNPAMPLPIVCQAQNNSIREMISLGLGKYKISEKILDELLDGQFFAVIDGARETELKGTTLSDFISSAAGATPLLLTARPSEAYRVAISKSVDFRIVEPQRLNNITYASFEKAYCEHDEEVGDTPSSPLTEELKSVCRGPDGTYLPILVRLALLVEKTGMIDSVRQLYNATFERLLRQDESPNKEDLQDQAVALCLGTYWENGQRTLRYSENSHSEQVLIKRLLDSGVLVSADREQSTIAKSKEVRFFHDSMQSYLTARGLVSNKAWDESLQKAAGDPIFRVASADNQIEEIPEVFQMCLEVFTPVTTLRDVLENRLRNWAEEKHSRFSEDIIRGGLTRELSERLGAVLTPHQSAQAILLKAIDICKEADGDGICYNLGRLYARIAFVVPRN